MGKDTKHKRMDNRTYLFTHQRHVDNICEGLINRAVQELYQHQLRRSHEQNNDVGVGFSIFLHRSFSKTLSASLKAGQHDRTQYESHRKR